MFGDPQQLIGRVIGGYRLEAMLGTGAMGVVFGGRSATAPQELVAIKLLLIPWNASPTDRAQYQARFKREAQTLQRLQHPHILSLKDFGDDQGFSYMVLPYMSGGTLATLLQQQKQLPFNQVVYYLNQIGSALDYAHSQNVIHRDIKPANILLDAQGLPYLADFSIVRFTDLGHTTLTVAGQAVGTPAYQAPEQADKNQVGPATDIYSLGIVAYELVTGRVPFQGNDVNEYIQKHAKEPPPFPRLYRQDLPEAAEAVILQALAKQPADRFSQAGQFAQAFALGIQGQWAPGVRRPGSVTQLPTQQYTPQLTRGVAPPTPPVVSGPPGVQGGASPAPVEPPPGFASLHPSVGEAPPYGRVSEIPWEAVPPPGRYAPQERKREKSWLWAGMAAAVLILIVGAGLGVYTGVIPLFGHAGATATTPPTAPVTTIPQVRLCNGQIILASELPTTGTDGAEGKPAENAVKLAVMQNQDVGGGYTLSFVSYNDVSAVLGKHDPDQGARNVTDMAGNKCILGFVGPFNSNVAKSEIPISENAGLVMISPANTNPGLTIQSEAQANGIDWATLHPAGKKETYFRLPGNDVSQGKVDADLALDSLSAKTVYVIDDQETYGVGIASYFEKEFKARGGIEVGRDGIPANGAAQIPGLAAKIAAVNPDVVYYGGVTSGGGGTLKAQLVAAGYTGPMIGGDGIADDDGFVQQAGADAANNTYGTIIGPDLSTLTSGAAAKFVSDYNAAFPGQDLGVYSPGSYDAANVIISAIKSVISSGKDLTRDAVIDAVQTIQYDGITSHISFDQNGDNANGGIWAIYEVQGGRWVFLKQVSAGA